MLDDEQPPTQWDGIMNEDAIISAIANLQHIFTVVLALSPGEAFKQFVSDRAVKPEDRSIRWDRLMALCSFLLLLIPFLWSPSSRFAATNRRLAPCLPCSL